MNDKATYDFEEAISCINKCNTLPMLSEFWSLFKMEKEHYSDADFTEISARVEMKAAILINKRINEFYGDHQ